MSKTTETNLWGIHGGKTGDTDTLFLKNNCVAVGQMNAEILARCITRLTCLSDGSKHQLGPLRQVSGRTESQHDV